MNHLKQLWQEHLLYALTKLLIIFFIVGNSLFLSLAAQAVQIQSVQDLSHKKTNNPGRPAPQVNKKEVLHVGILSNQISAPLNNSPWQLSFERLNEHPKYKFVPLFLTQEQLGERLERDELDFVICDAVNYLRLEKKYGLLRLLTRNKQYNDSYSSSEALSVYTLDDNSDITQLSHLSNKKIAVLDINSSISWSFLEIFLSKHHLNKNINIRKFSDRSSILELLAQHKVDVIISKSGLIEKSSSKDHIPTLRLINPHQSWQTPFLHSSVLIPEWPLSKAWFIDNHLANQVVSLLLATLNKPEDNNGHYFASQYRWSIVQNYHELQHLLDFSDHTEQKNKGENSTFSAKMQYWVSFIIICFLVLILTLYLHSSKDLNNRLTRSKESLEQEIKERQHAQEQALNHQVELAHVARLSTMGEMASGLAHELNQPLSAINTYVQGCIRRINMGTDDPEAIINALQLTAQQAERAGGIIRRLRSFVRKGETHKTYIEINHLINEVTGFLEIQLNNKSINLVLELENDLPPVLVDIIQIEQVLINLIKNAIEAVSDVAPLSIVLRTQLFNHKLIELCVIDSGHGISEDKLKRIFNPFFTTKASGMGMGLSISSSIIEAHGGKLYAQNNPHQGARFCFTLPIVEEQAGNNNE